MAENENAPATKKDVAVVAKDVAVVAKDVAVVAKDVAAVAKDVAAVRRDLAASEERLSEQMRDMQTELLKAFLPMSALQAGKPAGQCYSARGPY